MAKESEIEKIEGKLSLTTAAFAYECAENNLEKYDTFQTFLRYINDSIKDGNSKIRFTSSNVDLSLEGTYIIDSIDWMWISRNKDRIIEHLERMGYKVRWKKFLFLWDVDSFTVSWEVKEIKTNN